MSTSDPKWLTEAKRYVGQKEIPGVKHNPNIVNLWTWLKLGFKSDETAWCSAFVGAMFEKFGITSTRSAMARSYEKWGQKLRKPVPGCVAVFWRSSPSSGYGHVGFVYGLDTRGNLLILGGNQGDKVSVVPISTSRLVGYRWPKDVPVPTTKVTTYRTSASLSTNEASMGLWTNIKSIFSSSSDKETTKQGDFPMADVPVKTGTGLKGWKTIILNSIVAVCGVLATVAWPEVIPQQYAGPLVAALGFLNMYLRSVTTTAMFHGTQQAVVSDDSY